MYIMVTGLALFLGIHLLPVFPPLRAAAANALGEKGYKAMFSVVSAVGLVLIVVGYARTGVREPLFAPVPWARNMAPSAMGVAFNLLANGDRVGTVLFGAWFAYAVVDLVSAIARRAVKPFEPQIRFDAMAIVGGLVVALAVMTFHRMLFGVPVVTFSL